MLWEQPHVLINAETLNSDLFLNEPTNLEVKVANNKNSVLDSNDNQGYFLNIEDT